MLQTLIRFLKISFVLLNHNLFSYFVFSKCDDIYLLWFPCYLFLGKDFFLKNNLHWNVIRILIGRGDELVFKMLHILRGFWVGIPLWSNHMKDDIPLSRTHGAAPVSIRSDGLEFPTHHNGWGSGLTLKLVEFLQKYSQWLSNTGMVSGIPLSWLSGLYFHSEMYCHGCPEALILPEPIQAIFPINTPGSHNRVGLCVRKERSSVCRDYAWDALQRSFNLRATILQWKEFSSSEHLFYWNI